MEYNKIILTNLPAFYKINLYNKINDRKRIFVIFTGEDGILRNDDFANQTVLFDYKDLGGLSKFKKMLKIVEIILTFKYTELIVGGWNQIYYWMVIFLSAKSKNALVIESSNYESTTNGLRGYIKRIFLKRINKVYASGKSQIDILHELNFKRHIVKTRGVGLTNAIDKPNYVTRQMVTDFLYVGRLSSEKNLKFLIEVFNTLPHLKLNIIGYGPQEDYLKSLANSNCAFFGPIENLKLHKYYQKNDVFILPSISEPWGLVVEEALQNGLPVLLSDRVGCAPELIDKSIGLIFEFNKKSDLISKINLIQNVNFYNNLRKNVSKIDFNALANSQIKSYLHENHN